MLLSAACKKESTAAQHRVECSSNINDPQYYSLSINGTGGNNIGQSYIVDGNSDIELKLFSAGGDTASVDAGDSLWTRGGIIVDGKPVSSFAGYRDAVLSYHIQ
ncbi:MAG: hypothetical protein JWO44_1517 [Bacteroidetes bacterium]|nr:hypothetical protein [Bacteroidota bacterium]